MNRLKFRVWDNVNKTYDYKFQYNRVGLFYIAQNGNLFSDFGNAVAPADPLDKNKFTVEQCTGVSDKNGNLIYEGDIIRNTSDSKPFELVVAWSERLARFYFQDAPADYRLPDNIDAAVAPHHYEIIGNIHEQEAQK